MYLLPRNSIFAARKRPAARTSNLLGGHFGKSSLVSTPDAVQADFFFGASFLWTTSTLPLQLRWFQETSGVRRGLVYQLNNLALLLSFLACRILIVPYLMHTYGVMKGGLSLYQVPFAAPGTLFFNEGWFRGKTGGGVSPLQDFAHLLAPHQEEVETGRSSLVWGMREVERGGGYIWHCRIQRGTNFA